MNVTIKVNMKYGKQLFNKELELKNLFKEKRNRCRDGEKTMETRPK